MLTMVIKDTPISENVIRNMHWGTRKKLRDKWYWLILSQSGPIDETHTYYKGVEITGYMKRRLDYDNFVGGCKSVIVDNLTRLGLIKNDWLENIEITYDQKQYVKAGMTEPCTKIVLSSPTEREG